MGHLNFYSYLYDFLNTQWIILFLITLSGVNCKNTVEPVKVNFIPTSSACSERNHTEKIILSPVFVNPVGSQVLTLFIPCLNDTAVINAMCEFHDWDQEMNTTVTVSVPASLDQLSKLPIAYCKLPYLNSYGRILVELHVNKLNVNKPEIYSGYIYVAEPKDELNITFVEIRRSTKNSSVLTITWAPEKFKFSALNSSLDLFLLEYENDTVIEQKILSDVPNSGKLSTHAHARFTNSTVIAFKLAQSPNIGHFRVKRQNSKSTGEPSNWRHGHKNYKDNGKTMVSKGMCNRAFLYADKTFDSHTNRCDNWFKNDPGLSPNETEPCPPTLALAKIDARFTRQTGFLSNMYSPRFFQPGGVHFYRQSVPSKMTGGRQQCVYDISGNLLIGGAISASAISGGSGLLRHWHKDVKPFCDCCYLSNNCEKYFQKRPSDDGRDYKPPKPAGAMGDPHITTFDSGSYTFNGAGEFWMVKSNENWGTPSSNFSMQSRMVPLGWGSASICTAFVIYDGVSKIQIEVNRESLYNVDIFLDDDLVPFPIDSDEQLLTKTASIFKERYRTTVAYSAGFTFVFTGGGRSLNLIASASQANFGKIDGLLGHFDNNRNNDLMTPDGRIIPWTSASNLSIIHHDFGLKWTVPENESLFKYSSGKNWTSYSQPNFRPWFPGDIDNWPNSTMISTVPVPLNVTSACGNSTECVFDWRATGDLELANQTGLAIRELHDMMETVMAPVYFCDVIHPIQNGYINLTNYIVGSIVHFSCENEYLLVGSYNLTCVLDRKNGTAVSVPYWNGTIPTCEMPETACEEIRVPSGSYPLRVFVREGCSFRLNCLTYSILRNYSYTDRMIIWSKDDSVFAVYYKDEHGGCKWQILQIDGVQLSIAESTERQIVLEKATEDSAGSYECEAVAETSEFVWLSKEHQVTVLKRNEQLPDWITHVNRRRSNASA